MHKVLKVFCYTYIYDIVDIHYVLYSSICATCVCFFHGHGWSSHFRQVCTSTQEASAVTV